MDLGLLVLRVVFGSSVAYHGFRKFFRGGRLAGTAGWFEKIGFHPPGMAHAITVATIELGGGLAVATGLLTPLAATAIAGAMTVAGWTHRRNGFLMAKDGYELALTFAAIAVGLAGTGAGRWSLDNAIGLDLGGNGWFAFALLGGVGGGLLFVAALRREPAPAP